MDSLTLSTRVDADRFRLSEEPTSLNIDLSTDTSAATGHTLATANGSGIKVLADLTVSNTLASGTGLGGSVGISRSSPVVRGDQPDQESEDGTRGKRE
ncbi:MAG: hypothetical protein R3C05_19185 [Pirellulaceae bacterium]